MEGKQTEVQAASPDDIRSQTGIAFLGMQILVSLSWEGREPLALMPASEGGD